ncbi:MAG: L-2-amino-thiazoline-4-carboxylic acid hydrolase, partial [Anaerolineales bacterium]
MSPELGLPPEPAKLNAIGVLTRREIEARLLAPLLVELAAQFDREQVLEVARRVIVEIARQQGAQLAAQMGGGSLEHFAASLEAWKKDDAMQIEVLEQSEERFSFNVHRCRYAELYQALGIPELGALLSCNRDFSLIEGFNPQVRLRRTQTIMEGADYCDFRFVLPEVHVKTLYVLRHAKSSWKDADIPDHDRPLNKRGKSDAPRMGRLLREQDLVPDLIVSSTARRARDTVALVVDESGFYGDVLWSEDLYAAGPEAYVEVLQALPDQYGRVMVVGHNPGLEELVAMLTDEWARLPTAALAEVSLGIQSWAEIDYDPLGKLLHVWRP